MRKVTETERDWQQIEEAEKKYMKNFNTLMEENGNLGLDTLFIILYEEVVTIRKKK